MNGNSPIWWVLGALILLAIIGFAISAMGKSRTEARRHEASAIRDDSVEQEREMRVGISRSGCARPIVSSRMSRRTSTATALAGPQLGRVPVRALEPLLVSVRVLNALEPNDGGASGGWGNVDDDDDEALEPGRHRDDADPARTDPPRTAAPDCAPPR